MRILNQSLTLIQSGLIMSLNIAFALVTVLVTIYALIKRYETRCVLIVAGFAMAIFSLKPMIAFQQFDASMTKASLIIAICSAMGFAAAISLTKCDVHLVALLTRPLKSLGVFLLPACMAVTGICAVAIPSTAGLCAAVGPSMIPILIRSGFRPAIAATAIVCSTTPALLNPGVAHNVFVSKLANMEVMEFIGQFTLPLVLFAAATIAGLMIVCVAYRDYKKPQVQEKGEMQTASNLPEKVNIFYAIAPLVPVVILLYVSLYTTMKMSVATAMLIGTAYALAVTRSNPAEVTKKFFDGMGKGYANILGIIIAAGVFAAGLKAAGIIDLVVESLTSANHLARIGGAFGPYIMGVLTGSGDAAAFAFNEAVTPNAPNFGLQIADLGWLAVICGSFGRLSSPLAGGVILVAGMAGVNPMEVVKRSAPVMVCLLFAAYFLL